MALKNMISIGLTAIIFVSCTEGYTKENGKVVWETHGRGNIVKTGYPVAGADPNTFTAINKVYGKDKNAVYYCENVLKDADPATFEIVHDNYVKDKNHVYIYDSTIDEADSKTFVHVEKEVYKDKNHVYVGGSTMPLVDVKTFEVIKYPYSKDRNNIYCGTVPMIVKDKSTFKVTSSGSRSSGTAIDMFTALNPEYKWMDTLKNIGGVFYIDNATAKTKTEKFQGFKLVK